MTDLHNLPEVPMDSSRLQAAQRVTWVSAAVNVLLVIAQVWVGIIAHA